MWLQEIKSNFVFLKQVLSSCTSMKKDWVFLVYIISKQFTILKQKFAKQFVYVKLVHYSK